MLYGSLIQISKFDSMCIGCLVCVVLCLGFVEVKTGSLPFERTQSSRGGRIQTNDWKIKKSLGAGAGGEGRGVAAPGWVSGF